MDKYLDNKISHDFVIGDVSWFNVYSRYVDQDTLSEEFLEELSTYEGIESLEKVYFSENFCCSRRIGPTEPKERITPLP